MSGKKRGCIPAIIKDYAGYHITHTLGKDKKHTGFLSIYAGRNMKRDDFKTVNEVYKYIDNLINKNSKTLGDML